MELNFKTFGQGPPLIILHGLFGTLDNWQTLAKRWASSFTVYIIDQRNHGRSPHLDGISYPAMASDLAAFLDKEWIHQCHILGHSMGGKTAMQFALDYPDIVDKLVVVDITPKEYPAGHDDIFSALLSLEVEKVSSRKEAAEHLDQYIQDKGVVQFLLKNLTRQPNNGYQWKMNLPVLYRDYSNILAAIEGDPFTGPSLFVRGGKSRYVQDQDMDTIQSLFTEYYVETVADAGHWIHAERGEELFHLVQKFLTE